MLLRSDKIDLAALPFPNDFTPDDPPDYLDVAMGYLLITKDINIPKTREMMTSWLVVGFITWYCQFFDHIAWIGQSEDDLKACVRAAWPDGRTCCATRLGCAR